MSFGLRPLVWRPRGRTLGIYAFSLVQTLLLSKFGHSSNRPLDYMGINYPLPLPQVRMFHRKSFNNKLRLFKLGNLLCYTSTDTQVGAHKCHFEACVSQSPRLPKSHDHFMKLNEDCTLSEDCMPIPCGIGSVVYRHTCLKYGGAYVHRPLILVPSLWRHIPLHLYETSKCVW